jgi:hypothetical protein
MQGAGESMKIKQRFNLFMTAIGKLKSFPMRSQHPAVI